MKPAGERVEIPYQDGVSLCGYFVRSPYAEADQPVLISFGGLDSHKDEMWFMTGRGAVQRGLSVLAAAALTDEIGERGLDLRTYCQTVSRRSLQRSRGAREQRNKRLQHQREGEYRCDATGPK